MPYIVLILSQFKVVFLFFFNLVNLLGKKKTLRSFNIAWQPQIFCSEKQNNNACLLAFCA